MKPRIGSLGGHGIKSPTSASRAENVARACWESKETMPVNKTQRKSSSSERRLETVKNARNPITKEGKYTNTNRVSGMRIAEISIVVISRRQPIIVGVR